MMNNSPNPLDKKIKLNPQNIFSFLVLIISAFFIVLIYGFSFMINIGMFIAFGWNIVLMCYVAGGFFVYLLAKILCDIFKNLTTINFNISFLLIPYLIFCGKYVYDLNLSRHYNADVEFINIHILNVILCGLAAALYNQLGPGIMEKKRKDNRSLTDRIDYRHSTAALDDFKEEQ